MRRKMSITSRSFLMILLAYCAGMITASAVHVNQTNPALFWLGFAISAIIAAVIGVLQADQSRDDRDLTRTINRQEATIRAAQSLVYGTPPRNGKTYTDRKW